MKSIDTPGLIERLSSDPFSTHTRHTPARGSASEKSINFSLFRGELINLGFTEVLSGPSHNDISLSGLCREVEMLGQTGDIKCVASLFASYISLLFFHGGLQSMTRMIIVRRRKYGKIKAGVD